MDDNKKEVVVEKESTVPVPRLKDGKMVTEQVEISKATGH